MEEEGKTVVLVSVRREVKGAIALVGTRKDHSKEAINTLKESGFEILMITGDN